MIFCKTAFNSQHNSRFESVDESCVLFLGRASKRVVGSGMYLHSHYREKINEKVTSQNQKRDQEQ